MFFSEMKAVETECRIIAEANYNYPIDPDWTTDEIVTVIAFLNQVEAVYEQGTDKQTFLTAYQAFKRIVPSKMAEKQLDRQFEATSGYSSYRAVQAAKTASGTKIRLRGGHD